MEKELTFIKLTNAASEHLGNPLYMNTDWIVSVFPLQKTEGGETTMVFGGPSGTTWQVSESTEEVVKQLKSLSNKTCGCK
jgi:hypothetical protein